MTTLPHGWVIIWGLQYCSLRTYHGIVFWVPRSYVLQSSGVEGFSREEP